MTEQAEKQPFWETLGLPAPGTRISREAYDALPEVSFHIEWHDGVVIYPNWSEETMSPSPTSKHQRIVSRAIKLLLGMVPDGEVYTAPLDVRLIERTVQPDVFWVAEEGVCIDHDTYLAGPPDLIIEVLSSSNTQHDRVTKYDLYEKSGVREYWIVNPVEDYVEVYTRDGEAFRRVGGFKPGQTFSSPVLGQSVTVADLFEQ